VSFEVAPGQVIAVLGANGAGKTTLLRCLAGLVAPDRGLVLYDDGVFQRDRIDLRRRLHFLPDFPFLFLNRTILQHLGIVLRLYGAGGPGVEDRVLELLRQFDLLTLAQRPLGTLSRGQVYKAGLVAMLAADPELWLLDEPFASGMDPHGINAFKDCVQAAIGRGRTVIYSTQILEIAERFADRVCILDRGELRAFDSLAGLRNGPAGAGATLEEVFRQLRAETA